MHGDEYRPHPDSSVTPTSTLKMGSDRAGLTSTPRRTVRDRTRTDTTTGNGYTQKSPVSHTGGETVSTDFVRRTRHDPVRPTGGAPIDLETTIEHHWRHGPILHSQRRVPAATRHLKKKKKKIEIPVVGRVGRRPRRR